jgi:2-C-methyl-D-erythritol 4-phosphate cytidylyltransferase
MVNERPSATGIILAGGTGERFGRDAGKQLVPLAGKPALEWSVRAFSATPGIDSLVIACPHGRMDEYREAAVSPSECRVPLAFAEAGSDRQASLAAALAVVGDADLCVVHDGARPLLTPELVRATIDALLADPSLDGVVVGYPAVDTVKRVDGDLVVKTLDRASLWQVQTPQTFRTPVLKAALAAATAEGFLGTDDASLVERAGGRVRVIAGPRENIKLTMADDLVAAQALLLARERP